jgi:hypothetical protein
MRVRFGEKAVRGGSGVVVDRGSRKGEGNGGANSAITGGNKEGGVVRTVPRGERGAIGGWRWATAPRPRHVRAGSARTGDVGGWQVGPHHNPDRWIQSEFESIQMSLNDFKPFQINSNLFRSKQDLPELKKIELKHGCEDLEERITFSIGTSTDLK